MKIFINKVIWIALGIVFCISAQAQTFPQGPVKLVVPLTPGSGADTAARLVGKYLNKVWQQPVVVENKPGAGGLIGTGVVANAEANGQTLLFQSVTFATNPATYKKLPYDFAKPLVNIAYVGDTPYVMVTAPDGPYKSIKDIIAAAKAKPGEIPFASVGVLRTILRSKRNPGAIKDQRRKIRNAFCWEAQFASICFTLASSVVRGISRRILTRTP